MINQPISSFPFTVYVVEDEPVLLQVILKKLDFFNIQAKGFISGKQALEEFKHTTKTPDIIWLDYYLKDMNGLEFVEVLKKMEKWKNIPIVVVSNSASEQKVQSMLALGINKYLLKAEHRLEDIVAILKEIIQEVSLKKI